MQRFVVTSVLIGIFFPLFFDPSLGAEEIALDLESFLSPFVLESKRLEIPGYPSAFNPSVVEWKGNLLLSFRIIPERTNSFVSQIGLVSVDRNFSLLGLPQILDTQQDSPVPSRAEDARLIRLGERLLVVYGDNRDLSITRGGFRVYIGEIFEEEGLFRLEKIQVLSDFEGADLSKREKNWTPFVYDQKLLLAYSIDPHQIFCPQEGSGRCESIAKSQVSLFWNWGELRGGTQGLEIDAEHYLSFFHSSCEMASLQSKNKVMLHYFLGAYLFSNRPPFTLKKISRFPIIGQGYYCGNCYTPYWKPVMALFPCGYIADTDCLWLVYGKHDHELWISKIEKEALLQSLVEVEEED